MTEESLTSERILEAAEDALRRFGPTKTTVVDVARALGVSHGSVYRHFSSKAALRDAVTARWLARNSELLAGALDEQGSAVQKLRHWFDLLIASKRRSAHDDPELFATYMELVEEAREAAKVHVNRLIEQITHIIADGAARGEFTVADPVTAGQAVFYATTRFHNPAHAQEWTEPDIDESFEGVWSLILHGLGARQDPT